MTVRQASVCSAVLILTVLFLLVYVVLTAAGFDYFLALFTGFLVCLVMTPPIHRFAQQEAKLVNGESNADRKN